MRRHNRRQVVDAGGQDEEDRAQGCLVLHVVATAVIKQSESGLEEAVDAENLLELGTVHPKETV